MKLNSKYFNIHEWMTSGGNRITKEEIDLWLN